MQPGGATHPRPQQKQSHHAAVWNNSSRQGVNVWIIDPLGKEAFNGLLDEDNVFENKLEYKWINMHVGDNVGENNINGFQVNHFENNGHSILPIFKMGTKNTNCTWN